MDLLKEIGLLGGRVVETPIDSNLKLQPVQAEDVVDRDNFQCLVGRLIYLSHTRLDIAFAVSMVSQFIHSPRHEHFNVVYRILRYLKGTLRKRVLLFEDIDHLRVEVYTDVD